MYITNLALTLRSEGTKNKHEDETMKNMITSTLVPLLLCFAGTIHAQTFTVVGEEFAPFEFKKNGKVVGIDVDIARHILTKLGIDAEFKILPWKRAWTQVEDGEVEAVFTTSRKTKREPFVAYPKEDMWVSDFVFFVHKDKKKSGFKGFESAVTGNLEVGIIPGNSYKKIFWETFPYKDGSTEFKGDLSISASFNKQLRPAKDLATNLKKLAKGRIDLVIADKTVGQYTAKLNGISDQITFYDTPLYGKGYPMPFVKNSMYPGLMDIAEKYESALKEMKENGEYQKILDKWLK